jgi:uncharacterized protein (TIGR03437 family)
MVLAADGKPVEGADVQVTSSGGEPPFALEDAGGGLYTGMFQSLNGGPVALTATVMTDAADSTTFGLGGDLEGGLATPVIFQGGIVNAANYALSPTPIIPGSIVSLFGKNLADSAAAASGLPLPRELAGVKVLAGGVEAPLISVSLADDGYDQINFQVPVELAGLTYADVVVVNNGAFSAPEGISLAPSLPAVFTRNQQGSGAAAALHADFSQLTSEKPARAGETVLLFATGLGEVQPAQATGESPASLSKLTRTVQVTIGGRPAKTEFVGLAPGFVGLYQLNVAVPDGIGSGEAALDITVDGISSGEGVTIPVG